MNQSLYDEATNLNPNEIRNLLRMGANLDSTVDHPAWHLQNYRMNPRIMLILWMTDPNINPRDLSEVLILLEIPLALEDAILEFETYLELMIFESIFKNHRFDMGINYFLDKGVDPSLGLNNLQIESYEGVYSNDGVSSIVTCFKRGGTFSNDLSFGIVSYFNQFLDEIGYEDLPIERKIHILELFIRSIEAFEINDEDQAEIDGTFGRIFKIPISLDQLEEINDRYQKRRYLWWTRLRGLRELKDLTEHYRESLYIPGTGAFYLRGKKSFESRQSKGF